MKLCVVDNANAFLKSVRPRKTKLVRDAQQINLFALRSLTHYALNNDERANHSRFPLTNAMWRVRGRLTLMPVQPANAVCSGHRHAI